MGQYEQRQINDLNLKIDNLEDDLDEFDKRFDDLEAKLKQLKEEKQDVGFR